MRFPSIICTPINNLMEQLEVNKAPHTCSNDESDQNTIIALYLYDGPIMINGDLTLVLRAIQTGANVQSQIEHSLIYNDITAIIEYLLPLYRVSLSQSSRLYVTLQLSGYHTVSIW